MNPIVWMQMGLREVVTCPMSHSCSTERLGFEPMRFDCRG